MPRNKISVKIDDTYLIYLINDKNINKTLPFTTISRPTLVKYIKIKEELVPELFLSLDKNGPEKITMEIALYICDNILNPHFQCRLSSDILSIHKKDRKKEIPNLTVCDICCESNIHYEQLPCCKKFICESCLITTIETKINHFAFTGVKCPFCNIYFTLRYLTYILITRYKTSLNIPWMSTTKYRRSMKYPSPVYPNNLYYKLMRIIATIEDHQDFIILDDGIDFHNLLGDDYYFGPCSVCTPQIVKHIDQRKNFINLKIGKIEKQCVNDQNELVVFQPDMFKCIICKSKDEDYDNGEFKQCPHCGIKTVKPEGCNYIYCGDHRWCFICNERIENNNNGHNHHYYTGPGTSPYSDRCRESINYDAPKYIINETCECSSCKDHNGAPLCRTLDCMNRTKSVLIHNQQFFHMHCNTCHYS